MITCLLGILLVTRVFNCFLYARDLQLRVSSYPYVSAYLPKSNGKYVYCYITLIQNVFRKDGLHKSPEALKGFRHRKPFVVSVRLILTNGQLPAPWKAALYFYDLDLKQMAYK